MGDTGEERDGGLTVAPTASSVRLSGSSPEWLETLQAAEQLIRSVDQVEIQTEHLLHGGMYARTVRIGAGTVLTGALMRVSTVLIVNGLASFATEDGELWFDGYNVIAGGMGRKTLLVAHSDVEMTMIFPTQATTVEDAEREFTDEYELLMSRKSTADVVCVTGE